MQHKDANWAADKVNEDDEVFYAREVAYQYFHVLLRLKDFMGAKAELIEDDEDDKKRHAKFFQVQRIG